MKLTARSFGWLAAGVALMAGPALAHHSFAMFDRDKQLVLNGVVRQLKWTNPHAWLELDVLNGKGDKDRWILELNSPSNLQRQGWKSDVLKPGDKVTVMLNPLRGGERGGLFLQAKFDDGRVVSDQYLTSSSNPADKLKPAEW